MTFNHDIPHAAMTGELPTDYIYLAREEFDNALMLDAITGLPIALLSRFSESWVSRPVKVSVRASFDGTEHRGARGGLQYRDMVVMDAPALRDRSPVVRHAGTHVQYELAAEVGGVAVTWVYVIHPTAPAVDFRVRFDAAGEPARVLRQFEVDVVVHDSEARDWRINLPGNQIRRDVLLRDIGARPVGVSPIGGLRGSSGLILATDLHDRTLVLWPNNCAEISTVTVRNEPIDALSVHLATNLAADLGTGVVVECQLLSLDVVDGDAGDVRQYWPGWAPRLSLTSPPVKPRWMHGASLYEVQIGASLFRGGHEYCPYPTVADLIRDLDRIIALGFDVIQLMPRHPYPSYNVHDYFDIEQSYGDPGDLARLVELCHASGVRVILDVLLHGVMDQEAIDDAAEGVRTGPFASQLDSNPGDVHGIDIATSDNYSIAWSRHILDFEKVWREGSPRQARLQGEHPEWFFRNSTGDVTSVYTKAFDARHASWRRYFRRAMLFLLAELGVDGFRFDAPTYNDFANWADWSRDRASASALACVALFEDLRRDIKKVRPDALMYTEPSGHLLRRSMDLNYNYDEQWLVSALVDTERQLPRSVSSARHFLEWMEDRDAFLPPGSATAHHIDSHDTFWWPAWGHKWRREQFGVDATRALAASFMSLDGPFMMFTGGEVGIEELLAAMNMLRRDSEGYWQSAASYTAHRATGIDDAVISVRRTGATRVLDMFVNLSPTDDASVPLPGAEDRTLHFWHGTLGTLETPETPDLTGPVARLSPYAILLVSTPRLSSGSVSSTKGIA